MIRFATSSVDLGAEKDDSFAKQERVDVEGRARLAAELSMTVGMIEWRAWALILHE